MIEVAVTAAFVVVILGSMVGVVFLSQINVTETMQEYAMAQSGHKAMGRMSELLRGADPASIQPVLLTNSNTLQYQTVTGYSAGVATLGPVTTLGFQPAAGETINGADDNGDGRVDEGFLTMTVANQPAVQIAGDVVGLRFNSTPAGLGFSVDIGRINRDGQLTTRTFTQEISFRNDG